MNQIPNGTLELTAIFNIVFRNFKRSCNKIKSTSGTLANPMNMRLFKHAVFVNVHIMNNIGPFRKEEFQTVKNFIAVIVLSVRIEDTEERTTCSSTHSESLS